MKQSTIWLPLLVLSLLGCGRPASRPTPAKPEPKVAPAKPEPKVAPAVPIRDDQPPDLTRAKAEKELEALLSRLAKDAGRPIEVAKVFSEALPDLRDRVAELTLPDKAMVRVIPLRGARLVGALLHVVDPTDSACAEDGLSGLLLVAMVRDPASGQSATRIKTLSADYAGNLFKGKDVKVTFVDGARDPNLFVVNYEYSNNEDECVDRMRSVDGEYQVIFTYLDGELDQLPLVTHLETEHEPGNEIKTSSQAHWFTGGATDLLVVMTFKQDTNIETGGESDGKNATCVRLSEIFLYGPKGWEPFLGDLTKAKQRYPVLKDLPAEGDADTVEGCDQLSEKL